MVADNKQISKFIGALENMKQEDIQSHASEGGNFHFKQIVRYCPEDVVYDLRFDVDLMRESSC
jgi:hypothetical protein